jgi:hypothetical protein
VSSPPAWHPDPSGKHDHRWWDGERWTEHVADAGQASIDPLEAAPQTPTSGSHDAGAGGAEAGDMAGGAEVGGAVGGGLSGRTDTEGTGHGDQAGSGGGWTQPESGTGTASSSEPAGSDAGSGTDAPVWGQQPPEAGTSGSPSETGAGDAGVQSWQPQQDPNAGGGPSAPGQWQQPGQGQQPGGQYGGGQYGGQQGGQYGGGYAGGPPGGYGNGGQAVWQQGGGGGWQGGPPPSSSNDGVAVTALVVGIIAILISWIPVLGLLAGIAALVLGIVGRNRIRKSGAKGNGMAVTGIATGAVAILINLAVLAFFIFAGGDFMQEFDSYVECVEETGDEAECQRQLEEGLLDRFG